MRATEQRTPLGEQIVHACVWAKRSQADVARKVKITDSQMTDIIRGRTKRPPWHTVVAIADELGVSLDFLAGRGRDVPPEGKDIMRSLDRIGMDSPAQTP